MSNLKIKYKCKENDAKIKVFAEDGKIDELYLKASGDNCWLVIGYYDLKSALKKMKKEIKKSKL